MLITNIPLRFEQKKYLKDAKEVMKKKEFLDGGLLFFLFSLGYTMLIGNSVAFILFSISLILLILYSIPPIRLRKTIFGTFIVGMSSSLAFFFGYVSQGGEFPLSGTGGTTILSLGLLIFLAVSLSGVIKDRKDYEGDKRDNVKTIYTVFGLEKGKRISLAFVLISFLLPSFLFQQWHDLLFFFLAALAATSDFKKNENQERVLFYAFLLFLYCFLRLKFGN